MNILSRFAKRYRNAGGGQYVCTLCGAVFEDPEIVICPKCRGFVTERNA